MADFLESEAEESGVSDAFFDVILIAQCTYIILILWLCMLQLDSEDEQPEQRKKPKRKAAVQSDDEDEEEDGKVWQTFDHFLLVP